MTLNKLRCNGNIIESHNINHDGLQWCNGEKKLNNTSCAGFYIYILISLIEMNNIYNMDNAFSGKYNDVEITFVYSIKCKACKKKLPIFKKIGETAALYCNNCKEPDLINVTQNYKNGDGYLYYDGILCNKDEYIEKVLENTPYKSPLCKLCNFPECEKIAVGKTNKCIAHGGGTRCEIPACRAGAQGKTNKCVAHGGGTRCPNCITWTDSRCGSRKYDGYCATCFKHLFPDDDRSKVIYTHTKEIMVRNIINSKFQGFIHDKPLYTGNCDCTHRRRIDHRKLIGNTVLAIETDEFGHRGYDEKDEEIRYDDLYMIHSGKWIFIRFNPDNNVSKTDIDDKLDKLIETMEECIYRIEQGHNTELVEIIKLYC